MSHTSTNFKPQKLNIQCSPSHSCQQWFTVKTKALPLHPLSFPAASLSNSPLVNMCQHIHIMVCNPSNLWHPAAKTAFCFCTEVRLSPKWTQIKVTSYIILLAVIACGYYVHTQQCIFWMDVCAWGKQGGIDGILSLLMEITHLLKKNNTQKTVKPVKHSGKQTVQKVDRQTMRRAKTLGEKEKEERMREQKANTCQGYW